MGYTITTYNNSYTSFERAWRYYSYSSPTYVDYGFTEAISRAELDSDWVKIYYIENTDDAMDYVEDFKYYQHSVLEDSPDYPRRDGRVVYFGTETAIAVAKGK